MNARLLSTCSILQGKPPRRSACSTRSASSGLSSSRRMSIGRTTVGRKEKFKWVKHATRFKLDTKSHELRGCGSGEVYGGATTAGAKITRRCSWLGDGEVERGAFVLFGFGPGAPAVAMDN